MPAQLEPLTQRPVWKKLEEHYRKIQEVHLRALFDEDPKRGERFACEGAGIYLDYSKNRITAETLRLLLELAESSGLRQCIEAMFGGERINATQNHPVLHLALRTPKGSSIVLNGQNVVPKVHATLDKMADFSLRVRNAEWRGYTGKPLRNIISIGMGASDLGPRMAFDALRYYSDRNLICRFVSNTDGNEFAEVTRGLDSEETLFILSPNTFATLETLTNVRAAREWCVRTMGSEGAVAKHFVAISTNSQEVEQFGIDNANMFEFWDWLGTPHSWDSSMSLSLMIAVGSDRFEEMLAGFHTMDEHFRTAPFECNLPVLLGLIGIWYNNFFGAETVAIVPYNHYLGSLPAYIQQLDIVSNGKSVDLDGRLVDYETGSIIWGQAGTNGQHASHQLIHQGTKLIPCDFIGFCQALNPLGEHHDLLMANFFAQTEALAFGRTAEEAIASGIPMFQVLHRVYEGNRPTNTILMERLTPRALGELMALYEHKVFVQGAIWNLEPLDQWDAELSKKLANRIIPQIESIEDLQGTYDSSTNTLINRYRKFIKTISQQSADRNDIG